MEFNWKKTLTIFFLLLVIGIIVIFVSYYLQFQPVIQLMQQLGLHIRLVNTYTYVMGWLSANPLVSATGIGGSLSLASGATKLYRDWKAKAAQIYDTGQQELNSFQSFADKVTQQKDAVITSLTDEVEAYKTQIADLPDFQMLQDTITSRDKEIEKLRISNQALEQAILNLKLGDGEVIERVVVK